MTDERKPLIQVKNLDVHFGQVKALTDVSVDFDESEFIGLVGDNGAGKTTLIKVLCGIYKPTKVEVYFDGERVTRLIPRWPLIWGLKQSNKPLAYVTTSL
jgi:simple sugar transport system ATP-binding protein